MHPLLEYDTQAQLIMQAVFNTTGYDLKRLQARVKTDENVAIRNICFYKLYETGWTCGKIAKLFRRDHTSVLHGKSMVYRRDKLMNLLSRVNHQYDLLQRYEKLQWQISKQPITCQPEI